MAHFLRDEQLKNLTVDEEALTDIGQVFAARVSTVPEYVQQQQAQEQIEPVHQTQIIRFDNKGYRVFALPDLLNYFRQAAYVERIWFTLESTASLRSSRQVGSFMELRLDNRDPNASLLTVTSDSQDWVDASFTLVRDILARHKNPNGWFRTPWTQLVIQLLGVFAGFVISLWAATKIAPHLSIANPFLVSFFLALLVFSNLWGVANQRVLAFVNQTFPNIRFSRPDRDRTAWLLQGIVIAVVGAAVLWILSAAFTYIGQVLGGLVS